MLHGEDDYYLLKLIPVLFQVLAKLVRIHRFCHFVISEPLMKW